jgi:hypothetical protein
LRLFTRQAGDKWLLERKESLATDEHGTLFGKIQRHDRDVLGVNVLPHVKFSPIREWKDPEAFTCMKAGIKDVPEFWTLVSRVPLTAGIAEGKDTLLRAGLLFIAARATDRRIVAALAKPIEEGLRFQAAAAALSTPSEGIGTRIERLLIGMDNEIQA